MFPPSARHVTRHLALPLGAVLLLGGCGGSGPEAAPAILPGPVASSAGGMVVSGSALATRAGIEILEAGGNAMDAAVATAFALAVVEPTQSGLGGRTQVVFRTAGGRVGGIDGATQAPADYPVGLPPAGDHGWATVAVPGTVAALARAVTQEGRLSLQAVIAPALRYAREGFPLSVPEAARLAGAAADLALDPGARLHFLQPDGSPLQPGERWVQPVLADLLERIGAEGPDAFYQGGTATTMARDIQAGGGFIARADVEAYRTLDAIVVEGRYRDLELVGTHLPASGATTIQALQVLEHLDPASGSDGAWAGAVGQALLLAFRDRDEVQRMDPQEAARRLVSRDRAAELAREARRPGSPAGGVASRAHTDDPGSNGSGRGGSGGDGPGSYGSGDDDEPPFTTHLSVADGEGMVVALTQSLGPNAGARVASPELGFLYATSLGGYLGEVRAGERPWSSQSPMLVLRDGEPILVLGGAGARRIISAAVAVISRWADRGMPLAEAMAAPRLHATPGRLTLEEVDGAPWPASTVDDLAAVGLEMRTDEAGSWFARLNVIERSGEGFTGIADARWPGGGAGGPAPAQAR